MDKISNTTTSSNVAASAPNKHPQEAMVSSPVIKEEASNAKMARVAHQQASSSGERKPRPQLVEALRCPRCESTNTKFCYFNNYSPKQPRYFCKACRRYWTHGGALRNVPIGGKCRKNNRSIGLGSGSGSRSGSSSSSSSNPASAPPLSPSTITGSNKTSNTQLTMVPKMMMPASTTTGSFPNVLPTLMSMGGGSGFDLTKDNQHVSLPFTPLSLSNQAPSMEIGQRVAPSFLDMLGRGLIHGNNSNKGKDMTFLLPPFGAMHGHGLSGSTSSDAKLLVSPQQGVNIKRAGPAGVQPKQEKKDEEEDNNAGWMLDRYWTNPNNNNNKGK